MNLVIVESPSKAKTINKYLGKDYDVIASKGHVVDLPKSKLSIDVDNDFKPDYVITNPKSLKEIKRRFKNADKLILAVDLDREGEAIGWHIAKELKLINDKGKKVGKKPLERIVFSEITKDAINSAIKSPRDIDMNLVNAQQARRLLDRIVGYKLSPLLWKKIAFGLSAGRVQSVAVKLVVEREEERNRFNSEEYWSIEAYLDKKETKNPKIKYNLSNKEEKEDYSQYIEFLLSKIDKKKVDLKKQQECEDISKDIINKKWLISSLEKTLQKRAPKPPFITSTLQQSGVNMLGFTARRTMSAAQKLYEAGLITYMRTDSVNMSNDAIASARSYIKKKFGERYLPSNSINYKSGKSAQEAHECIRPSDFSKTSNELNLDGDLKRVYDLIWQRATASQMANAELEGNALVIHIKGNKHEYEFRSSGKKILFDGFLKVYPEKLNEKILPDLKEGQELFLNTLQSSQHFTQPPARYSEATLIKKLEELGVGRPSTYASIISTIVQRKYVLNENKYLIPTDIGVVVNKLLDKYFNEVVDYGFTAEMEGKLDNVAEGKLDWVKMLKDFYFPFDKKVVKNDKNIKRDEFTELGKSDKLCPECGSPMVIKLSKYGKFLSCTKYPECKGMMPIVNENPTAEEAAKESLENYEPAPKTKEGVDYIIKVGRFGKFWAHPDYPKVKDAQPLVLKQSALKEIYGEVPTTKDGRPYLIKKGRFGEFWAHPDYPEVKDIIRIKKKKSVEASAE